MPSVFGVVDDADDDYDDDDVVSAHV